MMEQIGNIATKTVGRWAWYFSALKAPSEIGKSIPIHEGDPQQGYYRVKNRAGGFDPVAIYYPEDSDQIVAYRSNQEVDPDAIWTFACRHPVKHADYIAATEGKGWPDDDATVAQQIAPAPPGHNSGDVSDLDVLRDQIEAAKAGAGTYAKITDDETSAKAQSLRNRLNELSGNADKKRDALKRPHLDANTAIDKQWMPLVKEAKAAADAITKAMSAWETEKLRRQREAERKAEEARREAEAAIQSKAPAVDVVEAPAPVVVTAPPVQTQIRGSYGRAASVKAVVVVTKITDAPALFQALNGDAELNSLMLKLAQRAVDAGRTVPGVETEEQAKVR